MASTGLDATDSSSGNEPARGGGSEGRFDPDGGDSPGRPRPSPPDREQQALAARFYEVLVGALVASFSIAYPLGPQFPVPAMGWLLGLSLFGLVMAGGLSVFGQQHVRAAFVLGLVCLIILGSWLILRPLVVEHVREATVVGQSQLPVSGGPNAVAPTGHGRAYVVTEAGWLYKLDPRLGVDDGLRLEPDLFDVDVGLGAVFATANGHVYRVERHNETITRRRLGSGDCELAVADNGVWFKDFEGGRILLLSRSLGQRKATIKIDEPNGMAVDGPRLWVTQGRPEGQTGALLEFNQHGQRLRRIQIPADPQDLVVAGPEVWVVHYRAAQISRYDTRTGQLDTFDLGVEVPSGLAAGLGSVWASGADSGAVSQISRQQLASIAELGSGQRPLDVAVSGHWLYAPSSIDDLVQLYQLQMAEVEAR
ncbi:MAG: hypothetical protein QOI10_3460 [Solirubrobacterales bacterium]|nr:hypothetical protein [Solirubrobacterales bacterium]